MKVKGYSLLEIILVTSFIIIFIVVINPGTYIDRFSKMLLKINVLNESELLVAKLNSFAYDDCDIQGSSSVGIDFLHGQDVLSLRFDSNQLIIQNLGTNAEAVLYRHVSPTSLTGFNFYNSYFSSAVSDIRFIDILFKSSLLDYDVVGSIVCRDHKVVLGQF